MSDALDFPAAAPPQAKDLSIECFDPAAGRWRDAPRGDNVAIASITLASFNTWFQGPQPAVRHEGLLQCLRSADADIIVLQETTVALLERLLATDWVRAAYSVARAPFRADAIPSHGLMILSRLALNRATLHPLPTHMGRWVLIAESRINGEPFAFATVHLESMKGYGQVRGEQLQRVFALLENGSRCLLAGDFNFCSAWSEENSRLDPRYRDLWPTLHPDLPGYTQDTDVNLMLAAAKQEVKKVRFDRVLLRCDHADWIPQTIELLGNTPVHPGDRRLFPSDHFGLRARLRYGENMA